MYTQNIENCLEKTIGQYGLGAKEFAPYLETANNYAKALYRHVCDEQLPAISLCNTTDDLAELESIAKDYSTRFDKIIILGTGGSSLGGQTLAALAGYGVSFMAAHNKLHFLDNIDPLTFHWLEQSIDPRRTGVIVISKSGTTAETVCQLLVMVEWFKRDQVNLSKHFIVLTEDKPSTMSAIAQDLHLPRLTHHDKIGGRFSVFSNVALLPAMIAGVDAKKIRAGGKRVVDALQQQDCAPVIGAALMTAMSELRNLNVHVMLPYIDRLAYFGLWYRQLWAESLGKNGKGFTPIRAMGTVDQHSQLQLYLDGPSDKLYTFITYDKHSHGDAIHTAAQYGASYLQNRCMGDLLHAEQLATIDAMSHANRPARIVNLSSVDEQSLGALLMHYMLETVITAHMIGVDPFDQPAVELGKTLTRQYLALL